MIGPSAPVPPEVSIPRPTPDELAQVNDAVGKDQFVATSGCLLVVNGVGSVVGPLIGGIAMSTWQQNGLEFMLVATQIIIAAWGLYRVVREAPRKHKGTFRVGPPVPVATHVWHRANGEQTSPA